MSERSVTKILENFDSLVIFAPNNWKFSATHKLYSLIANLANYLPVIIVRPELGKKKKYVFRDSLYKNISSLYIRGEYDKKQIDLLGQALYEFSQPIKSPLVLVCNDLFNDLVKALYSPLRVYYADENKQVEIAQKFPRFIEALRYTDLLVSSSDKIMDSILNHGNFQGESLVIDGGLDELFFSTKEDILSYDKSSKTALYFGDINNNFDFELISEAAKKLPDWTFNISGPVCCDKVYLDNLTQLPNVFYLGVRVSHEIKALCQIATVALWHDDNQATQTEMPLDLLVYLANGLPVLALPNTTCEYLPSDLYSTADSKQAFIDAIIESESLRLDAKLVDARIEFSSRNSSQSDFNEFITHIAKVIEKKVIAPDILLGLNKKKYKSKSEKKLNVLMLYEQNSLFTSTVKEYISIFRKYSNHNIFYEPASNKVFCRVDFNQFDVIIIHYSLRMCIEEGPCTLSKSYEKKLKNFPGYSIAILQDEYDLTHVSQRRLQKLNINAVFTCVPMTDIDKVYPKEKLPHVEFFQCLTGYSSEKLPVEINLVPMEARKNMIVYRGRELPYRYGDLGQEKKIIGEKMKVICLENDIPCDIEVDDSRRIYGNAWYEFLANSRATLGTESGANVFDFDGDITESITKAVTDNPSITYQEVFEKYLREHEGYVKMNQISPKIFESAFLRTALILFEGNYSGIMQPDIHYIPLKKDFSNVNEVLEKLKDISYLNKLTQRVYDDIIASGDYSYEKFITHFDYLISTRAYPSSRSVSRVVDRFFSLEVRRYEGFFDKLLFIVKTPSAYTFFLKKILFRLMSKFSSLGKIIFKSYYPNIKNTLLKIYFPVKHALNKLKSLFVVGCKIGLFALFHPIQFCKKLARKVRRVAMTAYTRSE